MSCPCPVLPALDEMSAEEYARTIGKPLCCTSCGNELELRCPEGHVHQVPRTRSPNERPPADHDVDVAKNCPDCGNGFTPRRYQRRCDDCMKPKPAARACPDCGAQLPGLTRICRVCTPASEPGTHSARTYQPKKCTGCGNEFTPTGPRALRCEACK